jgi:nitroreductase
MLLSRPVAEVISRRCSCRTYLEKAITAADLERLAAFLSSLANGPLGTPVRFQIAAASERDRSSLKGLGTYGVIKGASGFIIGAVSQAEKNLEDFGCMMEQVILKATDLGLGTCWLGGTYTKSRFAAKIEAKPDESIPAVASLGYIAGRGKLEGKMRRMVDADHRKAWDELFFKEGFGVPLPRSEAEEYASVLDMVRIGPSASNKQPWRIVRKGDTWHFYLQRTPGYGKSSFTFKLLKLADLQRVDMGIAMCHFALTAAEQGLKGAWAVREPEIAKPDKSTEYIVSWTESRNA